MRTGARPYSKRGTHSAPQRFACFGTEAGAPDDLRGLHAAMRRYLEHRAVLGGTAQALSNMERQIRGFIAWADERGVTHPGQVSRAVLERYQRFLYHYRKKDGEPLSVASRRAMVTPLKSWFKWLTRSGEIPANPAADLELPREIKRLPRAVLSIEEAERVLSGPDLGTPIGLRDRALMELLYSTGMRRMEAAQLRIDEVDQQRRVVLIRLGKGQKDRMVPLGERAQYWVQQYLDHARPLLAWNADEAALFLGNEGRPLSLMWLSRVVALYVERAGIAKRGGCHLLRHTMATLMLEGGADIRFIQAMLGHTKLETTQIYTQVAIRHLQQVHAMTHPGARRRERVQAEPSDPPGAPMVEGISSPCRDPAGAAGELLEALAREADEEAQEDRQAMASVDLDAPAPGVAADAWRRR
jgi:integrase/recombinase XerD